MKTPEKEKERSRKEQRLIERWLKLKGYSCSPAPSQRTLCFGEAGTATTGGTGEGQDKSVDSCTLQTNDNLCWMSIDVRRGDGDQQKRLLEMCDNGT